MNPDIHTLSDSLLWKRFLEGDSSAYTQIYNRTVQDLFRFGLLYTSDKELIKDCIHDAIQENSARNQEKIIYITNEKDQYRKIQYKGNTIIIEDIEKEEK